MKISELFGITKSQHELDFVDVDIDSDTPLFLDPYFIAKNDFPLAYEAHLSLRSYFECLLRTLREQLRFNGPLVQRRGDKKRTPYVTKKSIREHYLIGNANDKKWLADFTEKHPEVFRDFRKQTRSKISAVSNAEISAEPIQMVCSFLTERLKAIPMGTDNATAYHRTVVGILELLFYPYLCNPVIEHEIHDGRKRIDIVFDNCAESGFFFRLCNTHGIPSRFIMVECKNYSRDVANPEIDQVGGRFSANRGQIGIIACRAVDDMPKLLERCSDTFKDSRGLIIPMVDNDFYDLLNYKSEKNEQAIDNFLQHRFHAIASK